MRLDVISLFPEMFDAVSRYGITGRALKKGLLQLRLWNPRDYTADRHRTVDDRPYGGGPGMVLLAEPLARAIAAARADDVTPSRVIYLSPQGRPLTQAAIQALVGQGRLILLSGRYEGIDERLLEKEADEEWSLGDYVISGGELAAMVLIDAMTRLLPGALGAEHSAEEDSFANGLLDWPHYTRPESYDGRPVPAVLLSGDHRAIHRWRTKQAIGRTWQRRPELLTKLRLSAEQKTLLDEYIREFETKRTTENG